MATLVLPPTTSSSGKPTTSSVSTSGSGKASYTAPPGKIATVPDDHGTALSAQNWQTVGGAGPTGMRSPSVVPTVPVWFDTTIGKAVVWDGTTWRDPFTGAAA